MDKIHREKRFLPGLFAMTALLLAAVTGGCLPAGGHQRIGDLQRLPQNPLAYVAEETACQPLFPEACRKAQTAGFLEKFFLPWHVAGPLPATEKPFWAIQWAREHTVFSENLRPLTADRLEKLIHQAAPETYPSLDRKGITVRRCDLRALPTQRPLLNNPAAAGQGFPFDNLQHAALPANTPLKVTHVSRDGAWVFVETAALYGWLPATCVAWVNEALASAFAKGPYLAVTGDEVPVTDDQGIFRFHAIIGNILPVASAGDGNHRVLIAVADGDRQAYLVYAEIAKDDSALFPLFLSPQNLATVAERMMGQSYGWGESFGNRDCSATIRDLFAPFGIWLPRNSSRQAKEGEVIPLAALKPARKEERILETAVPFLTLIRIPGHIMLYLGHHEGRAAILHTLWGVRTKNWRGKEGRWLVGETVITTLQPGMERNSPWYRIGDLRERVASMNTPAVCDGFQKMPGERD